MIKPVSGNSTLPLPIVNRTSSLKTNLCLLCRGTKKLCGRPRCPVLVRFHSHNKIKNLLDTVRIGGSSPPSIFIGRSGYPKVSIGPMIPPVMGDTTYIDTPEQWLDNTIEDIVDFRSMLIRGTHVADVHDVESSDKTVSFTRELALSKNSIFTEALFQKKPRGNIRFFSESQPHGPSAPLKKLDITNPKYEPHIEKAYYDTDLKSTDAVYMLYKDGVQVSRIQKAFSVGAFGIGKYRRFVPTRWSITAVDSTIGNIMMDQTRYFPWINEFRVYYHNQFDNRWIILMMPSEWQYELIEAWYPNTAWNQYDTNIAMFNSYEFYEGRTTYADIGGCYYAARLAVNETLHKQRRQAATLVLREAHPGYIMPIGVWNVRESVRKTLTNPYQTYDTLEAALHFISEKLAIPLDRWVKNSALLKHRLYQRKLDDFF